MNKYKIHYQENQKIKSKVIISDDLKKEKLPENIVKIKKIKKLQFKNIKIVNKANEEQIIELFIQLSIMLDSNILLIDAIRILQKSIKNDYLSDILVSMESALQNGRPIYKALEKYEKDLNPIIIPFFMIFEKNGNIKAVIVALSTLLKIRLKNKKELKNSLRYPLIVMITFILALSLIFIFVVPKFENIFLQYNMQLPISTILLLNLKNFFLKYSLYLLLFFIFIYFAIKYFINISDRFSYFNDEFFIKYLPVIGSLNKTYELYNFFVALNILLQSKYEFHLSMEDA
ncbi:type II secretion system F family protein [Arcobacter sp. F2176]|uniref:type II secretion system F family protein n=1 Tax=Arcobacter sp. F2176 TaxID=2044511 RepID=UPI00100B7835|nr:type II secretion system F family protein [Arcobacter sp. F2176]RXJ79464.1 hypothetical protein CRU95_14065 [Arcobacter sp. F2176]